jgi:hypothetical protein
MTWRKSVACIVFHRLHCFSSTALFFIDFIVGIVFHRLHCFSSTALFFIDFIVFHCRHWFSTTAFFHRLHCYPSTALFFIARTVFHQLHCFSSFALFFIDCIFFTFWGLGHKNGIVVAGLNCKSLSDYLNGRKWHGWLKNRTEARINVMMLHSNIFAKNDDKIAILTQIIAIYVGGKKFS